MTTKEARPLIEAYYNDSGEKGKLIKKLAKETEGIFGDKIEVEAFLCHVIDKKGHSVYAICNIDYDSHCHPYASEYSYDDDKDNLEKAWRAE